MMKHLIIPIVSLLVFYVAVFFIIKFTGKTNLQAFGEIVIITIILTSLSIYISRKID